MCHHKTANGRESRDRSCSCPQVCSQRITFELRGHLLAVSDLGEHFIATNLSELTPDSLVMFALLLIQLSLSNRSL